MWYWCGRASVPGATWPKSDHERRMAKARPLVTWLLLYVPISAVKVAVRRQGIHAIKTS